MPTAALPRTTPAARSRSARAAAPRLWTPIRLRTARSSGNRNNRGGSLPGWARAVTVPSSAKPKPRAPQGLTPIPFLSSPAPPPPPPGDRGPAPPSRLAVAGEDGGDSRTRQPVLTEPVDHGQ